MEIGYLFVALFLLHLEVIGQLLAEATAPLFLLSSACLQVLGELIKLSLAVTKLLLGGRQLGAAVGQLDFQMLDAVHQILLECVK